MSKYDKVKHYYDSGLWSAKRVRDAVDKGWITEEEADEILRQGEEVTADGMD